MYHVSALVVAAVLWIACGIYSFAAKKYRKPWRVALFVFGGAFLAWYELHMHWYWLTIGAVLVIGSVFQRLFLDDSKQGHAKAERTERTERPERPERPER